MEGYHACHDSRQCGSVEPPQEQELLAWEQRVLPGKNAPAQRVLRHELLFGGSAPHAYIGGGKATTRMRGASALCLWLVLLAEANGSSIYQDWVEQPLDHHFYPAGMFKQRYLGLGGRSTEAVLIIGGEEPLTRVHLQRSLARRVAISRGASLYALEHRYYGRSIPVANLTLESLRHLSSRQALLDIGRFMRMKAERWVVIGGSYGGTLAALARAHFPDLVVGAIASSSPIQFKEDFFEYDLQVQQALKRKGGEDCLNFHYQVTRDIDEQIASGNMATIKSRFACPAIDDASFLDALSFVANIVQYSSSNTISDHCKGLDLSLTADQRIEAFSRRFRDHLGERTCQEKYDLSHLKSTSPDGVSRQWIYQCCTEFGFWQTAPQLPLRTTRSTFLDLSFYRKHYCENIFGKGLPALVPPNLPSIDKILFTNGELDPWASLSITNISISEVAHSADLDLPLPFESPSIKAVKTKILDVIENYFRAFQNITGYVKSHFLIKTST